MNFTTKNALLLALGAGACVATQASAQTVSQVYGDTLTRQTQTVFVRGDANFTTYQSEAADSNTTATTSTVTVGGFAGEKRTLGVYMSSNDQTIPFDLNKSSVKNAWRDLRMQARFGWFYPSVAVSMIEIVFAPVLVMNRNFHPRRMQRRGYPRKR